ncbi:hypothetical protein NA57DRAFT_69508 [Rhizodiscina lignyota]|uniref:Zn(2)-C6 fungal-type domain-containing protein n=1 Tax=Rhizodiscina lignyota TaxID=1504668 RepID=A0A9P4I3C8_9PEZI|nr:hypothetical protein NA57DRAFT_69508 [Rhizodiscina lignyota]
MGKWSCNPKTSTGCWTCRIRRKGCDNAFPVCRGCEALEIRCYHEKSKPEWMDSGSRQQEMAQKIKAEIKRNARRRQGRQKIQTIVRDIDEATPLSSTHLDFNLPSSANPIASSRQTPSTLGSEIEHDGIPSSATSTMYERSASLDLSDSRPNQQDSDESTIQDAPVPSLSLPNKLELIFVMAYLDYVFPVSFPFYRPTILEGGRGWLLSSILGNKCLHHTVISLTSYFFSVVEVNPQSANLICGSYTWEALQSQTELALKKAQRDLHEISCNGVHQNILGSANLIESIVNLLSVEVILGSNENWQMHLDAASFLFQRLLDSHRKDDPYSAFSHILELVDALSFRRPPDSPLWSPEQAAFRFFSAMLIFNDIVASTSLEQSPKLCECYPHLLGNDPHPEPDPSLQLADFIGCQNWALIAIGEIAALDAWKKSMKQINQLSVPELVQRGAVIDQHLRDGLAVLDKPESQNREKKRVPITQLDTLLSHTPCAPETINAITHIWALAARSYLLTTISGWQVANAELRSNVAQTIGLLTDLATSPTWMRTLAWPLCITGCLADEGEEVLLRQLLTDMGGLQAFGTLRQALSIMEHAWRNRTQIDTENWDLAACLRCLGHRALLV